jgi:endonuclease-3
MKKHETSAEKRARISHGRAVLREFKKLLPDAGMMLRYSNKWELLVTVMLSAQCTDKKVNEVTPALFARYRTLDDYANAPIREIEELVFQTGFYHTKARRLIEAARYVKQHFGGEIPMTMEEMLQIPGVARKTANVVLGNAHGVVEGIAVDTHVKRLARLLGLSDETDPVKIERDLMEVFPKKDWFHATYLMIEYGRKYCPSRLHNPVNCPLGHQYRSLI